MMINVISEPTVYFIGASQLIREMDEDTQVMHSRFQDFLREHTISNGENVPWLLDNDSDDYVQDEDKIPEIAGRVCYMSFDKPRPGKNKAYLEHIKETKHGSVLEHTLFNFILTGISRSLTHELVRHRVGTAFSQLSQRYVDHNPVNKNGLWSFICPWAIMGCPESYKMWYDHMVASLEVYEKLGKSIKKEHNDNLGVKQIREAQRSVLPNSTETKMFFSCNARQLRFIIQKRGDIAAEREIRKLAVAFHNELVSYNIFSDVELMDKNNDTVTVRNENV
jgi:thymidylate synthase (FAD)